MKSVVVLGATGSIGTQASHVIAENSERFDVRGLAAGGANVGELARQAILHEVEWVAIADGGAADAFGAEFLRQAGEGARRPELLTGPGAATELAGRGADIVLNGITGAVGLEPTLAALAADSTLALANKESLVIGGELVTKAVRREGQIVPVDSEHSAIAQCLRAGSAREVARIVLTASGGPFRGRARTDLGQVTPAQALAHPTWNMGPVVSINSATLVNKGLELIEAHLLFDVPLDAIEVVIHPQSIIHSMVVFRDGATIAQASPPTMLIPIALALSWPARMDDVAPACDFSAAQAWTFEPVDDDAFPAIAAARRAGAMPLHPAIYNAANEVCVAAFLAGELPFLAIVDTVVQVLADAAAAPFSVCSGSVPTLAEVLAVDEWARKHAQELLGANVGGES